MEKRQIGKHGLEVSALCLSTMTFGYQIDEKVSREILDNAMEHHCIFGEFWAERGFLLLRHAKTQNQWAKQVFRDTLIFAAYGEQGHELV